MTQRKDEVFDRLVDAGYRLVTEEGVAALTVRRLASESEVSTMAVYTRFGSVGGVAGAVCERGFTEFAEELERLVPTDDAVADLQLLGLMYVRFATTNPQLYTLMFQYTSPDWAASERRSLIQDGRPTDSPAGRRAFGTMLRLLTGARGEAASADPVALVRAGEVWSAVHGLAMLSIAGHLAGVHDVVAESMFVTMAVGHGADRGSAEEAMRQAKERLTALSPQPPRESTRP